MFHLRSHVRNERTATRHTGRRVALCTAAGLCGLLAHAQTMKHAPLDAKGEIPFQLNIMSDVKAKTANQANTDEVPVTGTGSLGVSFTSERSYGQVSFNVFNRNKDIATADSGAINAFTNNLLIPENSGVGFSNANITLGMRNFWANDNSKKLFHLLHLNRIGGFCYFQVNTTSWSKDSVTTTLFIQSHGVYLSYRLLDLSIKNEDEDNMYLTLYGGYEGRRLGGNYALDKNEGVRQHFLGTADVAFDALAGGVLLELGKFYGKLHMTNFGLRTQLDDFSGWQAMITLGMNVEFNIPAKGN